MIRRAAGKSPWMSPSAPNCIPERVKGEGSRVKGEGSRVTLHPSPFTLHPSPFRGIRVGRSRRGYQQIELVPDEVFTAVDGEFVVLAHEDRRHRAGFLTIAAEDAARLVDLVRLRVPGPCLD